MPLELIEADELAILRAHKAEHEEWAKAWAAKISTADAFCRVADDQRRAAECRAVELEQDYAVMTNARDELLETVNALNEENSQLAHRLWRLGNPA